MARYAVYKTNDDGTPDDLLFGFDEKDEAFEQAHRYPRHGNEEVYVLDGETDKEILRIDTLGHPKLTVVGAPDDDVSTDELCQAVEHMHGVPARFVEAVEVDERFNGEIVWQGAVKIFDLVGHPSGAKRAYAWSYRTEGTRRKFKAVLGVPPVDGPVMAVRASILAEQAKTKN